VSTTWYRCPNCGHASPDCFDEEIAETLAWQPDQVPCDNCGEHAVVLCPHCHHDYDPYGADRLAGCAQLAAGAPARGGARATYPDLAAGGLAVKPNLRSWETSRRPEWASPSMIGASVSGR
jgi:predicted RNA-binding Zn-ribbon protein involved in translation (DUF1610 family)